jgi:hypothetical protein
LKKQQEEDAKKTENPDALVDENGEKNPHPAGSLAAQLWDQLRINKAKNDARAKKETEATGEAK